MSEVRLLFSETVDTAIYAYRLFPSIAGALAGILLWIALLSGDPLIGLLLMIGGFFLPDVYLKSLSGNRRSQMQRPAIHAYYRPGAPGRVDQARDARNVRPGARHARAPDRHPLERSER